MYFTLMIVIYLLAESIICTIASLSVTLPSGQKGGGEELRYTDSSSFLFKLAIFCILHLKIFLFMGKETKSS